MFKILKKNNGQSSFAEYVIVFFMATGAVVSMTVFVQRALQARVRDTKIYMMDNIKTYANITANMTYEYEPYYANALSGTNRSRVEQFQLLGGGATGIFRKDINSFIATDTDSSQAPPKDAI